MFWLSQRDKKPSCHPDRVCVALDLCSACYSSYLRQNPEVVKATAKVRRERYASDEEFRAKHKEGAQAAHLKRKYRKTPKDKKEMLAAQDFSCLVCWQPLLENEAVFDHDHSCCPRDHRTCGKCIRGLLHANCNWAIGLFKDNPAYCLSAAMYLETWENIHKQKAPFA